jgi:hypothetical protein
MFWSEVRDRYSREDALNCWRDELFEPIEDERTLQEQEENEGKSTDNVKGKRKAPEEARGVPQHKKRRLE